MKKEQRAEVLKMKDRREEIEEAASVPTISAGKRGRLQEAVVLQKAAAKSTDMSTVTVRVFWVTVGTGPQFCNGETFGSPI